MIIKNTIHIQWQCTQQYRNDIILCRIQKRNDDAVNDINHQKQEWQSKTYRKQMTTSLQTITDEFQIYQKKNEDLLQFMTWEHIKLQEETESLSVTR